MSFLDKIRRKFKNVELYDADLDDYQRVAVDFLKKKPKSALFIDTGLGKTAICLRLIRDLIDNDEIKKVLIIAPLKVANQTWGNEIQKWDFSAPIPYKLVRQESIVEAVNEAGRVEKNRPLTDRDLKKIQTAFNRVMAKFKKENPYVSDDELKKIELLEREKVRKAYIKRNSDLVRAKALNVQFLEYEKKNPTFIHIVNQEMVEWLVNGLGNDWIYDCVIFDESDSIKDARTKRWKALDSVKHRVKHFHQLTATPAAESYEGLYAQIKLLDGGKRLGRTKTEFMQRYFDVNPYTYKKTLREGAEDAITKLISDITLVMKQEDFLKDIPPVKIENVLYEIPDFARDLYDEMSSTGCIELKNGTVITAEQAVSVLQKNMQISAGFVYESDLDITEFGKIVSNREIHYLHTAKIEALKQLMSQYPDDNFLISYYHQGSLNLLQKHFPNAVKMDNKGSQQAAWNDGKIKILLMHPKSGAHGLNLQRGGRIVINYDVYFSYGQFYQFWRRLGRRGQKAKEVLVFNLLARNTYDEIVAKQCWVDKGAAQDVLFDLLKKLKKKGKHG